MRRSTASLRLVIATQSKRTADEIVDNFNAPRRNWEIFTRPKGAAAFLQRHHWQPAPAALVA